VELRYALAFATGGGGGLGREIAVALARRGVAVLVADRDLAAAEVTAGLVREHRVGGWAFACDVTEEPELRALAARAREQWAALTDEQRAQLPPLVPPAVVARAVVDLVAGGHAGQVVEMTES